MAKLNLNISPARPHSDQPQDGWATHDAPAAAARLAQAAGAAEPALWPVKTFIAVNLFYWHLDAFEQDEDPTAGFVNLCNQGRAMLESARAIADPTQTQFAETGSPPDRAATLGDLYSAVYAQLDDDDYFTESRRVLSDRLQANGIAPEQLFVDKVVLDAGCGGGKATQAIAALGARRVIGVDVGEGNIEFARTQAKKRPHGAKLDYRLGSVLALPVANASVDLVWCNSVGHLTGNQDACLKELARVLRPGGTLFYYVNGKFGLYELLLKTLRRVMTGVPKDHLHHLLQALGIGAGRISWIVACLFAPYEFLPKQEIEHLLAKNGFVDARFLARGIETDFSERISRGEPHAAIKYNEGQLKYLARKA